MEVHRDLTVMMELMTKGRTSAWMYRGQKRQAWMHW